MKPTLDQMSSAIAVLLLAEGHFETLAGNLSVIADSMDEGPTADYLELQSGEQYAKATALLDAGSILQQLLKESNS